MIQLANGQLVYLVESGLLLHRHLIFLHANVWHNDCSNDTQTSNFLPRQPKFIFQALIDFVQFDLVCLKCGNFSKIVIQMTLSNFPYDYAVPLFLRVP